MLVVGLTGGIGAGKSTFAALLAERGAQVVDADWLGRVALEPGQPAWHAVVDQFGDKVLSAGSMDIDRTRLADIVFGNKERLAALNAIVHPVIFRAVADELEMLRGTDEIVVLDAALIIETGLADALDVLVVVTSTRDTRRSRLVKDRSMSHEQVDARMASQNDPKELESEADVIVTNDGSLEDLAGEADRVWALLVARNER
jgi:dephospho-CoA kinase